VSDDVGPILPRASAADRRTSSSSWRAATSAGTAAGPIVFRAHWVFTGTLRDQKGQDWPIQLMVAAKVKIIRYVKIRSDVNPYDPRWELYLEARLGWQLAQTLAGRSRIEYLWKRQKGRCRVCGQPLRIAEEDCQIHHHIWRSRGGPDTVDNRELFHANCHRQIHVQERPTKAAASREGRS
jgi:RNA-directed DNA polymerase